MTGCVTLKQSGHLKIYVGLVGGFELELASLIDSEIGETAGDDDYEEEDRSSLPILTTNPS